MFGKTAFIKEALVLYRRHATVTTAPKNLGFTDLVTMSKEASSESYSEIEQWISSIGSVLGRIEVRTDNEMLMRQAGVEHCRRKQEAFSYRAGMYACDRNFIHRVNVFFKMLNTGYYGPLQKGGLGLKSLLKDLSRLLTG
jgi:hypothetical protein